MIVKKIKYILLIVVIFLTSIRGTSAFYVDSSTSFANSFSAGSLDFRLLNTNDTVITGNIIDRDDMIPGDTTAGAIKIVNEGSLGFGYDMTSKFISGNAGLFNSLDITVSSDSTIVYSGSLAGLAVSPLVLFSSPSDTLDIVVTIPGSISYLYQLQSCEFELIVRGNQIGSSGGFWDEEIILGRISTSDWTSPLITNMMLASPGNSNGIEVTWNTDELATSNVQIGSTTSYGTVFPVIADTVADNINHSVVLSGLSLYTTYHMRVKSTDGYGNVSYSDDFEFILKNDWFEFIPRGNIVINEILPDPIGADDAVSPGGEWVELYNKGSVGIDVNGWRLCSVGRCVVISNSNTMSGSTSLNSGGFLVVFFENTYSGGILDNGIDVITLYTSAWQLRDMHWYFGTQEGKSIVRYPDGANTWYDPIPSPGLPNNIDPVVLEVPKKEEEFVLPDPIETEEPVVEEVTLEEVISE